MLSDPVVMLDNLVMSLSDSLDLIHHSAVDHQQRVAYVALRLAKVIGIREAQQADLMYAAALHDIGVLSVEEKIDTMRIDLEDPDQHAILGADILGLSNLFARSSELIRRHHTRWNEDAAWGDADEAFRLTANAIHLADTIDRLVYRDRPILAQATRIQTTITGMAGTEFAPILVDAFLSISVQEAFWLDLTSPRIYTVLSSLAVWPGVSLSLDGLESIGGIFSRIVDFRSEFTATHSMGVATTAVELARRFNFGERECRMMKIAGHLHDLGKVAVPNAILEKPAKLDPAEFDVMRGHTYHTYQILSTIAGFEEIRLWAAHHHERMDGRGYPFRLKGEELPLGSRIMAVADVFTALTENRPYRRGTPEEQTMPILRNMGAAGTLDRQIVKVLDEGYREIDRCRAEAQEAYAVEYAQRFGTKTPS